MGASLAAPSEPQITQVSFAPRCLGAKSSEVAVAATLVTQAQRQEKQKKTK